MTSQYGPHHHLSPDRVDPSGLPDRIDAVRVERPVGLLMIGWDNPDEADASYAHQVERSVLFAVAGCAEQTDVVTAATTRQVAVLRAPLQAPAAAEGLAHRIAQRLEVELDRLATEFDRPAARWALGVAVDRPEDRSVDLLRYAEDALNDAWVLGGRRVVAFDDGDRGLREPPA